MTFAGGKKTGWIWQQQSTHLGALSTSTVDGKPLLTTGMQQSTRMQHLSATIAYGGNQAERIGRYLHAYTP